MDDPVNVPGTSNEHANWQRKVSATLDEIFGNERIERLLGAAGSSAHDTGMLERALTLKAAPAIAEMI